jgi:hypothetical protein
VIHARPARLALPLLLSLAFAALCATSLLRTSGTWDEMHYLAAVGTGAPVLDAWLQPPLSGWIHGVPFHWLEIPDALRVEPNGPLRGQRIVALRADDWMLDSARLALLPLGVALGWVAFAWGSRLYGYGGGLLAMALVCFEPNAIAHAGLITPDVTLAAAAALALHQLARLAEAPSPQRRVAAGLALGVMLLAKHAALVLLPIFLVTDLVARLASRAAPPPALVARIALDWAALLALAFAVLWAGYGFEVGRVLVAGTELAVPAPRYVQGAIYQWQQSRLPHDFFLLGRISEQGWWYFYLVVALFKVPLGTLLLLSLALGAGRWLGVRWRAAELYLVLPALLLLLYLSFWNTIHNGFRYLLPVWVPLLVLTGRLALPAARSRAFALLLCVPLAWVVVATLRAWPDSLAYVNELGGGSRNGYRLLSDSNLDWGQGLEALSVWMREHDVARVQLAYFGTADPAHWGIDYVALPSPISALPPTPPLAPGDPAPRIVALSAYQYQGVAFHGENPYARFHELEPNDVVAGSILIFDLDHPRKRSAQRGEAERSSEERPGSHESTPAWRHSPSQ